MLNLSKTLSFRTWQYLAASCANLAGLFVLLALIASRNLPPTAPWWTADRIHAHYWHYIKGTQASPILLMVGALYIPYAATISAQMRHIPGIDPILPHLQLACAAASIVAFMPTATCLAMLTFRDYGPQLTQLINDTMWMTFFLPWPTFWLQWWTISWAVLADKSPDPIFPKSMAWMNLALPIVAALSSGVHMRHTGPMAWNGGLVYWPGLVAFGLELNVTSWCLTKNVRKNRV